MQKYRVFLLLSPSKSYTNACSKLLMYAVEWMNSVLLQNASITQATLLIKMLTTKNGTLIVLILLSPQQQYTCLQCFMLLYLELGI